MPVRTVQEDKHGLYVKDNGNVFRPQLNDFYRAMQHCMPPVALTPDRYKKGDRIKVHNFYDRLYVQLNDKNYWYSHGSYISSPNSEDCWEG